MGLVRVATVVQLAQELRQAATVVVLVLGAKCFSTRHFFPLRNQLVRGPEVPGLGLVPRLVLQEHQHSAVATDCGLRAAELVTPEELVLRKGQMVPLVVLLVPLERRQQHQPDTAPAVAVAVVAKTTPPMETAATAARLDRTREGQRYQVGQAVRAEVAPMLQQ